MQTGTLTRQLLFDKKKKRVCQSTPVSTSPLRNLTLPAWIEKNLEERYVTNPSLPSLCIGLNSRFEEGMEMPNFFSQLMESVRFVLWKIFSNLIPLQSEGDNEEYREYRVWAPLLRNFVLIHLLNLIPSQFPSEISNVERELYFNPLLWNFTSLWIPLQFHPAKYRILNYITPYCETRYIYIYINSNS